MRLKAAPAGWLNEAPAVEVNCSVDLEEGVEARHNCPMAAAQQGRSSPASSSTQWQGGAGATMKGG